MLHTGSKELILLEEGKLVPVSLVVSLLQLCALDVSLQVHSNRVYEIGFVSWLMRCGKNDDCVAVVRGGLCKASCQCIICSHVSHRRDEILRFRHDIPLSENDLALSSTDKAARRISSTGTILSFLAHASLMYSDRSAPAKSPTTSETMAFPLIRLSSTAWQRCGMAQPLDRRRSAAFRPG